MQQFDPPEQAIEHEQQQILQHKQSPPARTLKTRVGGLPSLEG
ncbi:hypothetical protein [Coleofasciculus sp. H7-2]